MGGSFVPEPGLVGPPPSCTGTNSASNRDSHSESATTKEHRRFFVTSLKFTHGDNTWHLYTISFLMGKPQTDSSKKRQGQRVFCNLSHIPKKCSNSARQLIQRASMSRQKSCSKTSTNGLKVSPGYVLEPMACLRPDTRMSLSKMFLDFRQLSACCALRACSENVTDNVSDIVDIEDPSVVVEKAGILVEFIPHVCHRYTYC